MMIYFVFMYIAVALVFHLIDRYVMADEFEDDDVAFEIFFSLTWPITMVYMIASFIKELVNYLAGKDDDSEETN